jgi:ribonuclease E
MTNKLILIDAAHREETRIAVLENGILQDFDRESITIKQIKGNIYLAKVIRIEPSLQAAFVDYEGNRHGFLPFAEIHPDYYNLSEQEREKITEITNNSAVRNSDDEDMIDNIDIIDKKDKNGERAGERSNYNNRNINEDQEESITIGSYDVEDETEGYVRNIHGIHKRYNIQDVIKPGQSILVQVAKEERGNKGAAMTSYISIAGKYCVLMSNTPDRGGVSKKVDNFRDRKMLKSILNELSVPNDRSIIIRTAGVGKRPEEIKRDYEYLTRLWENIVEISAKSNAPTFIHAEDDIIKKAIRDIYNETISEVIIEGQDAFDAVSSLAKLSMPHSSHNIKLHNDKVPVFNKYRVEQQIFALYEKQIFLPSGGSIVIDHTEALVAIDVNSGRATKESGLEETAFKTNMEAVTEIARQLRLRDLAGLIVIDFIDMYDQRHRRNVERSLRDSLQNDRARIQFGRISVFGLLEMSRQRLGASFFETISQSCKACNGTGYIRSAEIIAVSILRAIRNACLDKQVGVIYIYTSYEAMMHIMNYKKQEIINTEKNYNVHIFMHYAENLGSSGFDIKKRKHLSDEERKEIEMEVVTGKVNMLGIKQESIENSYLEEYENSSSQSNNPLNSANNYGKQGSNNRNRRKNHRNKDNKNHRSYHSDNDDNDNNNEKKSVLVSIFDFLKRNKN